MFLQQNKPNDSHLWYKVLWMDTILCRECKSACSIVDSGTLVCTNCGLACEQDSSSVLQMYEDRDGSFRGTCTFHPFSTLYKPSTTHQERAAKCLFNECQQVVAKLSLDSSCLPQLESLVTQAAQLAWPCYKHWLSASSAACVYIVSRMHSKALNMTDCSIAANCIVSEMGRVYQQLVMELKLQVPFEDPFSLLWRVCNVVLTWLFPNSETESSPTRIGRLYHLSCNLLWYAEQRWLLTGRKPIHVVIAVTTLAAICCGWTKQTSRRELWIAMSKELSSTEHSIRQRYNELIDTLLKDAKELLPWADQLDAKTIHPNISLLLTVLGYPKEATTNKDDCHYPHPVDYAGHFTPTTQLFLPPCVQHEKKRKKTKAAQQPKK